MCVRANGDAVAVDPEPLHRTISARADELAPLRRAVADYARSVGVVDPFAVALALSETVSNAIVHAYVEEASPGDVEVHAEPIDEGESLRVTVVDHGRGMVPRGDSPGIGAGLPLVSRVTKRFDISRAPDGGTRVCMVFPLAG
jgi:serine/threonine-protein kinase RsbW/stage II sporulation protein AB (anti-sigma F factor)